ncbi:hypothetical protein SAMN05421736_12636 [Evansella caseinilytica]|uniref:Uncharacterized protein n=1 Tax=Evansella caseinilytica TaxID=1503961 RepID=A0A1H3UTL2_9BACI|nr:hypothetical protein [Evansella caseinilytica]SDZ65773.1 hypothetical protein SAMN05421736_12636 [Evansella caseinilytica]
MEPFVLLHIILGSILTLAIIMTLVFLLRWLLAPKEKKSSVFPAFRKSAITAAAIFLGYMLMVWVKKLFF